MSVYLLFMQILHESRLTCTNLLACNFLSLLFSFSVGFPLCVNCARCSRIYLHDSRNLSGAKNISQVRTAAAEIDCSPEPQVAK